MSTIIDVTDRSKMFSPREKKRMAQACDRRMPTTSMRDRASFPVIAIWCPTILIVLCGCGDDAPPDDSSSASDSSSMEIEAGQFSKVSIGPSITIGSAVNYGTMGGFGIPPVGCGFAEPTTVAFAPGEHPACPDGRLLFGSGTRVLRANLDGTFADPAAPLWTADPQEAFPPDFTFDQHIVKLKNGQVLFVHMGTTWEESLEFKPGWWDVTETYPINNKPKPGGRRMLWMWRSSDCGMTWEKLTGLDCARIPAPSGQPAAIYATPRKIRLGPDKKHLTEEECAEEPECKLISSAAGADGQFVYADPYSGDVFLTVPCAYGTEVFNERKDITFVFRSVDNGDSWVMVGELPGKSAFRGPLTSLPSGEVAFGYSGSLAIMEPAFQKKDLSDSVLVLSSPAGQVPASAKIYNVWGSRTLARVGGDFPGFLYSAPYWMDGNKLAHRVWHVSHDGTPLQEVIPPIVEPNGGDTLWATFIDGPPTSSHSVLYWVERTSLGEAMPPDQPLEPMEFRVKCQVFHGAQPLLQEPAIISVVGGVPYAWEYKTKAFPGDYMGGASYTTFTRTGREYHFIATWSEAGCLRFNEISVTSQVNLVPKFKLEETRPPEVILPGDVKGGDEVNQPVDSVAAPAVDPQGSAKDR